MLKTAVQWNCREYKSEENLPDEDALRDLIGARSGFCITRNVRLRPLLTQVTTSLLIKPPAFSVPWVQKSSYTTSKGKLWELIAVNQLEWKNIWNLNYQITNTISSKAIKTSLHHDTSYLDIREGYQPRISKPSQSPNHTVMNRKTSSYSICRDINDLNRTTLGSQSNKWNSHSRKVSTTFINCISSVIPGEKWQLEKTDCKNLLT